MIEATKYSLSIRYSLLPLFYTELYKSSQTGRPVIKSLGLIYPNDRTTYDIETQFLIGDSIMIIPILERNTTETDAYLPAGLWYDYIKQIVVSKSIKKGKYLRMRIPLDRIGVLIRGGQILFTQKPGLNTVQTRKSSFDVVITLNENDEADGSLYYDDGEDYRIQETKKFNLVQYHVYKVSETYN